MSRRLLHMPFGILFLLFPTACVLIGCGGNPPDRELEQARAAIESGRAAGADRYAADEYAAAREALRRAEEAVQARDYRLALNHALDSLERAQGASKLAVDAKAADRAAAEQLLTAAAAAVAEADAALKAATSASRQPARALAGPRTAVTELEGRLQEARTAFAAGDYAAAREAAEAIPAATRPVLDAIAAGSAPPARRRR